MAIDVLCIKRNRDHGMASIIYYMIVQIERDNRKKKDTFVGYLLLAKYTRASLRA